MSLARNTPNNVEPLRFSGDDHALVAALRLRHPGAAAALWDRYAQGVHRTITRTLGPDAEAPDLLQETFIHALADIRSLDDPSRLGPWLTTIAVFTARACLRRRARRKWLSVFSPVQVQPTVALPVADDVRQALQEVYAVLNTMPADERLAFALRLIDGLPLAEAAASMKVSLATFKRRLAKAEARFLAVAHKSPRLRAFIEEGERWELKA
ncbi:MAG: sigma-70 family RNA polymerase sigma factor [Deltaproteobacteria bacterium]|nr:sigma-70 family RNA polymerase sigma factor [Deltaproteobacteria bacterium]